MSYSYNKTLKLPDGKKLRVTIDRTTNILRTGSKKVNDILNGRVTAKNGKNGWDFCYAYSGDPVEEYRDIKDMKKLMTHLLLQVLQSENNN